MRSRVVAVAVFAITLLTASPAAAETYFVTGIGDTNDPQGCLTPASCPTLRDAVLAAGTNPGQDAIVLPAGPITLTAGQLPLDDSVTIVGAGARLTTLQAASQSRVFQVSGAINVGLANMTITGGAPISGDGGNILVGTGSTVVLSLARVTSGNAISGGGIANQGSLSITYSLIDHNNASTGGAIYNGGPQPATLVMADSTVAFNTVNEQGGGILSSGTGNSVSLLSSTVAGNTKGGLLLQSPGSSSVDASIIAANPDGNCSGTIGNGSQNVESSASCGFDPGTNRVNADPQLSPDLVNAGGGTDVLTIPASSPAVDYVTPCLLTIDQRSYNRVPNGESACDAGAYEQSGVDPNAGPEPTPTPEPPVPTPTPAPVVTAVPTPTATPVTNKSVAADVTGDVKIKDPKTKKFIPLKDGVVPNGSEIDARNGEIVIKTTTPGEQATFFDGIFKISQSKKVTTLTLTEELDCKTAKGKARAAAKKPKTRKLWGDGKGKFRTKGQYSAATIRGTKWLVTDACTTTTTKVAQGTVSVDDFASGKTVVVRKGKSYVARAKRKR